MKTLILLLLLASPATTDRIWIDGTLKDMALQSTSSRSEPGLFSGMETTATVVYLYTIETAERFYVAAFFPGNRFGITNVEKANPIELDINGPVKFAVEKKDLYIKDRHGKEYRMRIVKQGIQAVVHSPGER